jgi:alcohol dehydrogenase (cytochrome c)
MTGGGAFYVTGSYDPATNLTYWGSGNPVPGYDSSYRPGDNLYTNSAIAFDAANGKIKWHFQYTPNDNRDYDEIGSHILIDTKINGEDRKILSHAGRNGFEYIMDRTNGQFLKATQHVRVVTWTKGIDPKTGKPVDYDPARDLQIYNEPANVNENGVTRRICPEQAGGTNFWPPSYSRRSGYLYIPANEGCATLTPDTSAHVRGKFAGGTFGPAGRIGSSITMIDPSTGELKRRFDQPYSNAAGVLTTGGGLVVTALLDGTVLALDDQTLEELWKINLGTGFNAPPMTYSVNGKQYVAIASGLWRNSRNKVVRYPELKTMSSATMLFVFGL